MCGIVGLFLKSEELRPDLGAMLTDMLVTMTDRGPDSAGIAIYGDADDGLKLTVQSDTPDTAFAGLDGALSAALDAPVTMKVVDTHAVLTLPEGLRSAAVTWLSAQGVRIMGVGHAMELYKEVGLPADVAARFGLRGMAGSHGIGHTRMATERRSPRWARTRSPPAQTSASCITGRCPTTTRCAASWCAPGMHFETENDSEVAAAYI